MKTKHLLLLTLAVLLGMVGCKEPEPEEPTGFACPDEQALIRIDNDSSFAISTAYHMVADNQHEYAFICGPIKDPACVLKLQAGQELRPEWYQFPSQVRGQLARYLPSGASGHDVSSGKLRVLASDRGLHFYTVDARAGGQLFALGYDGAFIEVGHNGSGSLAHAGQERPIDGACLTASKLGNYDVVLLLLTSATTSAEADLVLRGTSLTPGTYPIGDALTLLSGGSTGQVNNQELASGSLTIVRDGDTYTLSASGSTQNGASFSLSYTGTVAVIE